MPGPARDGALVAVDIGTSGARASAFGLDGAPLGEVRRSYPTELPGEGRAEQDAGRWRSAALSALTALVRDLRPGIAAIGLTGQCPSVVPLGHDLRPLRPGIIYRDNRATVEAQQIRDRFGDARLHALTGHVPAAFHVAAKILWIRVHEPEVFAATRLFVQPSDYVGLALTGEPGTDWSQAAATALLDLRHRRWATELLAGLDLDPGLLPAMRPSWQVIGGLRPALARRLQISPDTPVVAGAGDSIACAIGAGVTAPGPVSEMAGSSSCFNSVVPEPLTDPGITHYPSAVGEYGYVTEVGLNTTGEALDWLAQLFYDRAPRRDDFPRIERAAAASPPGADGLLFAPVLGDGDRDDPDLRGTAAGLSLRHDRSAWARATLEGVAFGVRDRLETLARASTQATELRVSGGGARIALWNQIKADVTGTPVVCIPGDSTAAGTAALAGLGAGLYTDAGQAEAAAYRPGPVADPDPRHRGLYDDLYGRYLGLTGSKEAGNDH
jgi:xylulokinase